MLKRLCIGIALTAVVACGGGGGEGGDTDPQGNDQPVPSGPIEVGPGDAKQLHANIGDTLEFHATEPISGVRRRPAEGKECHGTSSTIDNGMTVTFGPRTTECIVEFTFKDGRTGQATVIVP